MPSMIDLLLNSGNSSPLTQLSARFGISEEQARQAVDALAPALSIGMKRNVASPQGAGSFVEALSSGRHEQYANQPELAMSGEGVIEGNKILGHLLGSKDVSRAVAVQASQVTGIDQSALKQMLPVIASMVMGSMFQGAKQGSAGGSGGILGQILGSVMGGATNSTSAGGGNPLGQVFQDMLGGGSRSTANNSTPSSSSDNPLGDLLGNFLDGGNTNAPQVEQGDQRRQTPESGNLTDVFGDMFETGRKPDDPYQNSIEGIFVEFLK